MNIEKKVFNRKIKQIKKKRKLNVLKTDNSNFEPIANKLSRIDEEDVQNDDFSNNSVDKTANSTQNEIINIEKPIDKNSILTDITFESLRGRISDRTLDSISQMGFTHMTEIQQKTIEPLLEGLDIYGSAKTGSGKTLAFLIPVIELLIKSKWRQRDGTGIIILSPTRELSMQTYSVVNELMEKHSSITHGLVMGGANRNTEAQKLVAGVAILVATPGRLLDHLKNTEGFNVNNLKCFIIDEADRIFDVGFEEELHQIVRIIPKKRQTILFSATHSLKVDDLVKVALRTNPLKIDVTDKNETQNIQEDVTAIGLEQGYVVCPSERRFQLLFTFLKKNKDKKVMVFISSCAAVQFYNDLLNFIDLPVQCIHGKQKQQKRTCTFFSFCQAKTGILLCTDIAARGLDIPEVDWIIQYDPPDEPREYIHRVGRTARGISGTGHALLILRPEELGFLRFLKAAKVTLNEYEFSWTKLAAIQPQLEKLISQNYYLNKAAKEAYKGYIRSYDSHSLKQIFDVNTLDLIKVANSFGFSTPPFVELPISNKPKVKTIKKNGNIKKMF